MFFWLTTLGAKHRLETRERRTGRELYRAPPVFGIRRRAAALRLAWRTACRRRSAYASTKAFRRESASRGRDFMTNPAVVEAKPDALVGWSQDGPCDLT